MAIDKAYDSLLDYLDQNGIRVGEIDTVVNYRDVTEEQALEQLLIISEFHKKIIGYNGYMNIRLDNKTGKIVEQYKIYNKKLKRDIKKIKLNKPENQYEELLLEVGDLYLDRAEASVEEIYKWDYIDLISRSMQRVEICLGCTDFNNIAKEEGIVISSLDNCCYNMVENDGVYLINKLKKKGLTMNWENLIYKYCDFEGLEYKSAKFISGLVSYPYEFMKCCNRYRENKKDWDELKYKQKLLKIIERDNLT